MLVNFVSHLLSCFFRCNSEISKKKKNVGIALCDGIAQHVHQLSSSTSNAITRTMFLIFV